MPKRHQGRPGRNPSIQQVKLKSMLDQLGAPSEGLRQTIVQLQEMNQKLHETNKSLVSTTSEILEEFDARLRKLETAQFGTPDEGFDKYKGAENVQLSSVREDVATAGDAAAAGEDAGTGGPRDKAGPSGNPEGDSGVR